ncbi:MAG: DUF5054 domain-containing protein [Clostridiales bacterium]|nr:DUF5054 domain-containing protein [Clostridiales bacterium]
MKKIIVVSKTHMDLGFTDYAENIKRMYIESFIPDAVKLADNINTSDKKSFVWTTGSWILKETLDKGTVKQREYLKQAIERGHVVPHAMPFTVHTELLDEDTLDYGLSIADRLDVIRGRKTVAAKMTDVPGHTRGLVRLLAKHGIKLLHIGVNGASAMPEVPECFLWKDGDSEVVVIYSGEYGGAFQCEFTEEILYIDHSLDNKGVPAPDKIKARLRQIEKDFPEYTAEGGTFDEYADIIWEKRNSLPVFEGEIGDTWIHGAASDPYKSAALRTLMTLKTKWLRDGSMKKGSREYAEFSDCLLCIAEHTWGADSKIFLADYSHYLKKDFLVARKEDKKGAYAAIEKSWTEQREYIDSAVNALSDEHGIEAKNALEALRPEKPVSAENFENCREYDFKEIKSGGWKFKLNSSGGIGELSFKGDSVIRENELPAAEYRSFNDVDYYVWLTRYSRNIDKTAYWAVPDFARPKLHKINGQYPSGRFAYKLNRAFYIDKSAVLAELKCDGILSSELGAPRIIQLVYRLEKTGLSVELSWFEKDANRLSEAVYLRMFPAHGDFILRKTGTDVDPNTVVRGGGRNLHAVQYSKLKTDKNVYRFTNFHSPLISIGKGKILEYDNKLEDIDKDGIAYVLQDNVWGTNFPLWYEDNACFKFEIAVDANTD